MRFLLIIVVVGICSSCCVINTGEEIVKSVWGSSTRVLEKERDNAITKIYNEPYAECMHNSIIVAGKKKWVIFKKDEAKGYMVVMGIKDAVNTTEVGIFFVKLSDTQTRIELSSLSTFAKRQAAKDLFHGLDIAFGFLPPDLPEPKETPKNDTDQTKSQKS